MELHTYAHRSTHLSQEQINGDCDVIRAWINGSSTAYLERLEDLQFVKALQVSSPTFASALVECQTKSITAKAQQRLLATLDKFRRRSISRATPFGALAGVGALRQPSDGVGGRVTVSHHDSAHTDIFLASAALDGYLYSNHAIRVSSGHVEVPERVVRDRTSTTHASRIRLNALTQMVWKLCYTGLSVQALLVELQAKTGSDDQERQLSFLNEMIKAQVLFASRGMLSSHEVLSGFAAVHELQTPIGEGRTAWVTAETREPPPREVQLRISRVARVLSRSTQFMYGVAEVAAYANTFISKYGKGLRVPLVECVDEITGIGFVSTSFTDNLEVPDAYRDVVQSLLHRAIASPSHSVELTDQELAKMAGPDRSELAYDFDVLYHYDPASDRVAFASLACTALPGQSLGRFWPALPDSWFDSTHDRDARGRSVEPMELHFLPVYSKYLNVAALPRATDRYITTHILDDSPAAVALSELELMHDGKRLMLLRKGSVRPIVIRNLSMFNWMELAPKIASTIMLIARETEREWIPFSWAGEAHQLVLPEVTYRGVVVSKAAWRIPPDLFDATISDDAWVRQFQDWKDGVGLPAEVEVGRGDNLLRFGSDDVSELRGLRAVLDPSAPMMFRPAVSADAARHEYIHRVAASQRRKQSPAVDTWQDAPNVYFKPSGVQKDWISVELVAPSRHLAKLPGMAELVRAAKDAGASNWHFVRYEALDQHMRWRAQLPDRATMLDVADVIVGIASNHYRDIRFTTFRPEHQRYGGEEAFPAIQRIFTASSVQALDAVHRGLAEDSADKLAQAVSGAAELCAAIAPQDWVKRVISMYEHVRTPPGLSNIRREALGLLRTSAVPLGEPSAERVGTAFSSSPTLDGIISSVLHMHANRFFGISEKKEVLMVSTLREAVRMPHTGPASRCNVRAR